MQDGKLIIFSRRNTLSGTSRFARCRASKCPFHTASSINRTCAAHRVVYITNGVQTVYLLRHCRASYIRGAEFDTHMTNKYSYLLRLSIAPWTRAIRSSSDVTGVPYIILFILPHRKHSRGIRYGDQFTELATSTNPLIWIYATLRWFRTSERIMTPVRSQTSTLYSTQTVSFRTGVPTWTMISLPSCIKRCRCFGTPCIISSIRVNTGQGQGMRCGEAPILKVCENSEETGRPRLSHHHRC